MAELILNFHLPFSSSFMKLGTKATMIVPIEIRFLYKIY
jgi:hypothetical protein